MLKLYVDDGSLAKLDAKRDAVMALPRPVRFNDGDDWVKGKARVQFLNSVETSNVSLRLKGDWADHIFHSKKMSLRIKAKKGGYLFGMKEFSVQHPRTRIYGFTPLIFDHMRAHDIITPRYRFIDLYINDNPIGIMLLEEHFTKEMLESQSRRDGPILAIEEDAIYRQWHINYNVNPIEEPGRLNFKGYRDLEIKNLNGSKFSKGTIETNNQIVSYSMLRDFLDGTRTPRDVFDYKKLSRYWVLTNIWGACHGTIWHNRRFYFNPISRLMEPISFDHDPSPRLYQLCADVDVQAALQDSDFLTELDRAIADIRRRLESAEFAEQLQRTQDDHARILNFEAFSEVPAPITISELKNNLSKFEKDLDSQLGARSGVAGTNIISGTGASGVIADGRLQLSPDIIDEPFLNDQSVLHTHLSAFYFHDHPNGFFEFRNLSVDDIEIEKIYGRSKSGNMKNLAFEPLTLASAKKQKGVVQIPVEISDNDLHQFKTLTMEYVFRDQRFITALHIQFKNVPPVFNVDPLDALQQIVGAENIDKPAKQVTFVRNIYEVKDNIQLPVDWSVYIEPGAELKFKDGALLKLKGPLQIMGTAVAPVKVNIESNLTKNDMGVWGGIFVSQSSLRSSVNHLMLTGTPGQYLKNRQGYLGLTGCLSFFESDVDIAHSQFNDLQCEDALNIVKSDFTISNSRIERARADAFDSDFSTGTIIDSEFIASGNDGVDVSGTRLSLQSVMMRNIGDKAVSVGEDSHLTADKMTVDGAVLGIVSKDRSRAEITHTTFENISGTALMTYIKKPEYGPSSLDCSSCSFVGNIVKTGQQSGTTLSVNDVVVKNDKLTPNQMIEAGLMTKVQTQ